MQSGIFFPNGISVIFLIFASLIFTYETYIKGTKLLERAIALTEFSTNEISMPLTQAWLLRKVSHPNAPAPPSRLRPKQDAADKILNRPWVFLMLNALIIPVSIIIAFSSFILLSELAFVNVIELIITSAFVVFLFSSGYFELNDYFNQIGMNPSVEHKLTPTDRKYFIICAFALKARSRVFLGLTGLFFLVYIFYQPLLSLFLFIFAFFQFYFYYSFLVPLVRSTGAFGIFFLLWFCIILAVILGKASSAFWKFMTRIPQNIYVDINVDEFVETKLIANKIIDAEL
ncbi:MAG: hypothetical protein ACXAC7_05320 [Candidatus Hodarchaeales archaeon]